MGGGSDADETQRGVAEKSLDFAEQVWVKLKHFGRPTFFLFFLSFCHLFAESEELERQRIEEEKKKKFFVKVRQAPE